MYLLNNLREIKQALRRGPYSGPGMYPTYFVTSEGEALSHEAVLANWREVVESYRTPYARHTGGRIVGIEFNYEDADLYCDHTGKRIPSAYAEDYAVERSD